MIIRAPLIFLVLILAAGCASDSSYRGLPARYTALQLSPGSESYLIEVAQAIDRPFAMRFEFDRSGENVAIQVFELDGPRALHKKSGKQAARLLYLFRTFDWNALGAERSLALYPDDAAIILKAWKAGVYREARGGAAEHPALFALLKSVSEIQKVPNQLPEPMSGLAPVRGSS